mmetsp:Transcript_14666/g.42202  ORF Transcript_14666/g.42202 Transcript_14666/m.42202 type:complete len:219 (+) Transcript_14666:583-1239(+)
MNSSLSNVPLSSLSAFKNSAQRNSVKPWRRTSAKAASSVCLDFVVDKSVSDATAVNKLIIVHETNVMKATKKKRQSTLNWIIGVAISAQLSTVVSWNNVNSDVGMFANNARTSSAGPDCSLSSRRPLGPTSRVMTMLSTKQNMKILVRMNPNVPNMRQSKSTKALSLSLSRARRYMRRSRVSFRARTCAVPVECVPDLPWPQQHTARSKTPRINTTKS